MAVVNGIGNVLKAILNGIMSVFNIIIGCLTCNRAGGRRRGGGVTPPSRNHLPQAWIAHLFDRDIACATAGCAQD
ncbi:hypothetical protein XANCAGTX0491_002532 [Xanthoria calcicola]